MADKIIKIDDDKVARTYTPDELTEIIDVNEIKQDIANSQAVQDSCVAAETDKRLKLQEKLVIAESVGVTPKLAQVDPI